MVVKGKRGFSGGHDRLATLFGVTFFLQHSFCGVPAGGWLERERLLMLAVLEDAITVTRSLHA
jgi:hypothetical protein